MAATEGLVFDVEGEARSHSDWATSYICFIDRMRRSFPTMCSDGNFSSVCIDVTLQTRTHRTKLRIRCYNFHLVGYQMEDPNRWFEFGADTPHHRICAPDHVIKGSYFLDLGEGYGVLESGTDGQILEGICIGQEQLVRAVNLLATSTCLQDRTWSLIVARLMICEGCRFTCVSDYIATASHDSWPPPPWMLKMTLHHSLMPLTGLQQLQDAPIQTPLPVLVPKLRKRKPKPQKLRPRNTCASYLSQDNPGRPVSDLSGGSSKLECGEEALDPVILIENNPLLGLNPDDIFADSEMERKEHNPVTAPDFPLHLGPSSPLFSRLALAELFSIRVTSVDGSKPCRFYGTIAVSNMISLEFIYKRGEEESELVNLGDTLPLRLPRLTVSATDSFDIIYSLTGVDVKSWLGHASWCWRYCNYDEPLTVDFYGKCCSVRVYYAALSYALQVSIEVTIIDGGGRGQSHVYGQIAADWGCFDYEAVLFQKTAQDCINVGIGEPIELIRSVICLPVASSLMVRADLYEHMDASVHDDEISKGIMEFPIGDCGASGSCISRECGGIRVKVSWDGDAR